jgi:hypothetical protein
MSTNHGNSITGKPSWCHGRAELWTAFVTIQMLALTSEVPRSANSFLARISGFLKRGFLAIWSSG